MKRLWTSDGGTRDLAASPQAVTIINDYYNELYRHIESGNILAVMDGAMARLADPWK